MELNTYQIEAAKFARHPDTILYPVLGLCGESGEVAEKVKKVLRDKEGYFDAPAREAIAYELGDVLWYVARAGTVIGFTLDELASMNLKKLTSRHERGVLGGSGDNR